MKITMFSARSYDRESFDPVNAGRHRIDYRSELLTAETARMAEGHEGVCISVNDTASREVMAALKENGCRILVTRTMGHNHIDLDAARDLGLTVASVPHYSPYSVSEFTVGLILALTRKIYRAYIRSREFDFDLRGLVGTQLHDKTVGVVGAGQIGQLVLKALSGFGCRLLYHDIAERPELADIATYVSIADLASESDIVTLNVPLTKDTYHLVNDRMIPQLKEGVLIINTGRGALIDAKALVDGLKSGEIGGAALDVYEEEAGLFYNDRSEDVLDDDTFARLLTFPNVIVTSHMAYLTDHALSDIATSVLGSFTSFEAGDAVKDVLLPAG